MPAPDPQAVFSPQEIADLCASFQRAVVTALLDRTFDAAQWFNARSVGVAGGVAANSRLRADLVTRGAQHELPTFVPSLALATDNAAMIGAAGHAADCAPRVCRARPCGDVEPAAVTAPPRRARLARALDPRLRSCLP